jgi:hypothetical protein
LFVPNSNVTQMSISSYDNSYLMSTYSPITFQTACSLPCYTCLSAASPSVCQSCYSNTLLTNQIYYFQNNCYIYCPNGTFNVNNSLTCSICSSFCSQCIFSSSYCT